MWPPVEIIFDLFYALPLLSIRQIPLRCKQLMLGERLDGTVFEMNGCWKSNTAENGTRCSLRGTYRSNFFHIHTFTSRTKLIFDRLITIWFIPLLHYIHLAQPIATHRRPHNSSGIAVPTPHVINSTIGFWSFGGCRALSLSTFIPNGTLDGSQVRTSMKAPYLETFIAV